MDLKETIEKFAKNMKEKAVDGLEINRIQGDIFTEKRKIELLEQKLGQYYWAKFLMGDQLEEEAMEICDKIVLCNDNIARWNQEIQNIKENTEEEATIVKEDIILPSICKSCGATLPDGNKFCGQCGKEVE